MKTENVKQQTKVMIGELLENKKVSCDVKYVIGELHKQGLLTQEELDQITNILQTKKE